MTMPPAMTFTDLKHNYPAPGGEVQALRGVSLTIERGEFFGLFGANGAGKSTLIRILATLLIPHGGQASVMGFDVVRQPAQARGQMGLVFANENSFYGRLTGRQNLEFFAALQRLPPRAARARAGELLNLFNLTPAADSYFQTYSTGMRQKLNVARALLHDPPVLFLDEPTKGMDVVTAENLRRLLRRELVEKQGKTILLTTHDLDEMESLCDRVAILEEGVIRAVGSPADLIRQASETLIYRLELGNAAEGLLAAVRQLPAVRSMQVVSQTAGGIALDITFADALASPNELWRALVGWNAHIKRYAPREDGLRTLIRRHQAGGGDDDPSPLTG